MKKKVIVIGYSHYNTIGVVQTMGYAGVDVILVLIGSKKNLIAKSNFVHELYTVDNIEDGVKFIVKNLKNESKTVIIPCGDGIALELEKYQDILQGNFLYQHTDGVLSLCELMNKNTQIVLAKESGFDVPMSLEIEKMEDVPSNIDVPVILKPLLSCEGDKKDICVLYNNAEVKPKIEHMLNISHRVLVQQFIEQKDCELNILGVRKQNGQCYIPTIIEKTRLHPKDRGSVSVCKVFYPNEDYREIIATIARLMDKMKYIGLFSIELMVSKSDKKKYFIEANLRNDALNTFVFKYGANLPYIHMMDMYGEDIEVSVKSKGVKKMICETMHLTSLYRGSVSFLEWFKDIVTSDGFMYTIKGDRQLFFRQFIYKILKR